jgi:phage-related protein
VIFHPQAREVIRRFPKEVRDRLGRNLFRLQMGEQLGMPQSRPMPTVAAGVSELRVRGEEGICRVFYQAAPGKGILVFHAFVKKTQRTPSRELQLAKRHRKELLDA